MKHLLTIGLLFASFLVAHIAAMADEPKPNDAVQPAPRDDRPGWTARHERMNARVEQGNAKLLFIGDSITQRWERAGKDAWKEFYADRDAVNLGIDGDRTQHVLWRLENGNLEGIEPKLAVVMIGTNNSGANTPREIADGVAAIVAKLRAKLPETTVLVLSIFPRGADDRDTRRPVIAKTNSLLAKLADGKKVLYEDIGEVFLEPDGTISREIMPDLLHLSPAGYQRWAEAIEPTVARVLGDTPKTAKKTKTSTKTRAKGVPAAAEPG
ncbi:MAG TPA: GDSL family lipase [Planctomycetaceae bacterium]|nr:GDSL family lipase [Planctomycetaceae bacterium]